MAQDKYLSWDVFFNDPVIRNIYDSPACLAWLVDDVPPSLPSSSETFPSMSRSARVRPSKNTLALMTQAGMLPVGPVPPILPSNQAGSSAAATFFKNFHDQVSTRFAFFSHIIDGIAVGYAYDPNTSIESKLIHPDAHLEETSTSVHSDAAAAVSIAEGKPVSSKFAAMLYNHEIMTMILAKYPGGSYLVITGCSDYASTKHNMHYYMLTDMPRAVVLLSPPTTSDELRALEPLLPLNRHHLTTHNDNCNDSDNNDNIDAVAAFFQPFLVNGKSKLRDQQTGSNIPSFFTPVLGKGYSDTYDAHLVFYCYLGLERQCPLCSLLRIQCECPSFMKQVLPEWTALPEKIRRTYNPTMNDFMAKFEATHNGTYFTTICGQVPQRSFRVEGFSDILTSVGSVQLYDFAKAAYINQDFRKIFKPRIMMGLSSTDLCDPDCRKRNDDDDDLILLRKDNIDEIMQNPVRFFVSLKISTSTEKRRAISYSSSSLIQELQCTQDQNPPMSGGLKHPFMNIDPIHIEDETHPYFLESTTESANDLTTEPATDLTTEPTNELTTEPTNDLTTEPTNKTTDVNLSFLEKTLDSKSLKDINNSSSSSDSTIKITKTKPESIGLSASLPAPMDRIPCPQCKSTFKTAWHLREHIKVVHVGMNLKGHKCDLCDASFARKGDRNKHIRHVHEKVRKHVCEDCGLMYPYQSALEKHRKSKHGASG